MKQDYSISQDKLNLYIDDQLDAVEMDRVHRAIKANPELGERVCHLKEVRDLVGYAYETVPVPSEYRRHDTPPQRRAWSAVAAVLLITLGLVAGWVLRANTLGLPLASVDAQDVFHYYKYARVAGISQGDPRYIIHVSSGDDHAIRIALEEAEILLKSHRQSRVPLRLEVMVNNDIRMLREDSPFKAEIEKIMATYDNVTFLACARTLAKTRRREGKPVRLIPKIVTGETAREHIPERLREGWVYLKV